MKRLLLDAHSLREGCGGIDSSLVFDTVNAAPVARLFVARSPAAIAWLVIAVIVDALNTITGRAWTHICQKLREAIPALTNGNSSSTVKMIVGCVWIKTSFAQRTPNVVFTCLALSVRAPSFSNGEPSPATARTSLTSCERVFIDSPFFAAVAATPKTNITFSRSITKYSYPAESFAYHGC